MMRTYEAEGVSVFFDLIQPPKAIVVIGAEQDSLPLVQLAKHLGWHVTVVDTRCRAASSGRFAAADEIVLCRPENLTDRILPASETSLVVMTHNYLADVELLKKLLPAPVEYLGILGPRARTESLLAKLHDEGVHPTAAQLSRLHAPVGIDIGAETPEEVALAIVAEIRAVDAGRRGCFLCDRSAPIHDDQFLLPGSISRAASESSVPETTTTVVCAA